MLICNRFIFDIPVVEYGNKSVSSDMFETAGNIFEALVGSN